MPRLYRTNPRVRGDITGTSRSNRKASVTKTPLHPTRPSPPIIRPIPRPAPPQRRPGPTPQGGWQPSPPQRRPGAKGTWRPTPGPVRRPGAKPAPRPSPPIIKPAPQPTPRPSPNITRQERLAGYRWVDVNGRRVKMSPAERLQSSKARHKT